jgi:glutathionylspermidine synthase
MQRLSITPRPSWRSQVEAQGLLYHDQYYTESAAYVFSEAEILNIEKATQEIFDLSLTVVDHVVKRGLWDEFQIPRQYGEWIAKSWKDDAPSFYGRLDLSVTPEGSIKLLEFNADTPTSLLEAAVVQWQWLQDHRPGADQFNSIHEKLLEHMRVCKADFHGPLHFACVADSEEDFLTVKYLQDVATQAGIRTAFCYMHEIGVSESGAFTGADSLPISNIFKLYPWEWMMREEFGPDLIRSGDDTLWIEPPYKAILSNKMLLVYLHLLFPNSPYILPAQTESTPAYDHVRKPIFGREGSNTSIMAGGNSLEETSGDYGEEGFICQKYAPLPDFDGWHPVVGSWLIGGAPAGIGIRESRSRITDNRSQFVPHYFQ